MIKSKEQIEKEFDEQDFACFDVDGDPEKIKSFINNIREQDRKDLIAEIESGLDKVNRISDEYGYISGYDTDEVKELLNKYK